MARPPLPRPTRPARDSAQCSAVPPIDAVGPGDKNNNVLATHARLIGELRSSKKRIARAYASVQALIHQLCEEPRSNGHDWT
jgi:hypothetical protein